MTSLERAQHLQSILSGNRGKPFILMEYGRKLLETLLPQYVLYTMIGLVLLGCLGISYLKADPVLGAILIGEVFFIAIWPFLICALIFRHYGVVSTTSLASAGLSLPEGFLCDREGNIGKSQVSTHTKLQVLQHLEHLPARVQAMVVKHKVIYYVW